MLFYYLQNWSAAGLPPPHRSCVRTSPFAVPFTCQLKQLSTLPRNVALPLVICILLQHRDATDQDIAYVYMGNVVQMMLTQET